MSVFDRLTPPLRSRDPAVRLRAVSKHPPMDLPTLERLARQDPDPRVRQEAVRRIEAPRSLLSLRESAGDEDARGLAARRAETLLVKIAADDRDLEESRRALGLLEAPRAWSEVVCRARFPELREEALARLTAEPGGSAARPESPPGSSTESAPTSSTDDLPEREAALGFAARKAEDPALRAAALRALSTEEGLARVAVSAGDRDIASAAVRRLRDPALLLSVAERASGKGVRRLAQRRAEELLPPTHPERTKQREASLCRLLDRLESDGASAAGASGAAEAFDRTLAEAEAILAEGPVGEPVAARLEALRERRRGADPSADDAERASLLVPETPVPKIPEPKPVPAARPLPDELEPLVARVEDEEAALSLPALRAARKEAEALLEGFPEGLPVRGRLRKALAEAESRARSRKKERVAAFLLAEMADQAEALRRDLEKPGGQKGKRPAPAEAALARRELTRLERRFAAAYPAETPSGTPDEAPAEPPTGTPAEPAVEAEAAGPSAAESPAEAPAEAAAASPSEAAPADSPPESPSESAPESPPESPDADRFRRAAAAAREILDRLETEREEKSRDDEKQVTRLDRRLAALESAKTLSVEEAEAALRELGALRNRPERWRRLGAEKQSRLQRRQAALMPRLREARELREWRRWSNLAEQEELIRRARELTAVEDEAALDRELGKLERQWREVRHADRDRGQALWEEWTRLLDELTERVRPRREAAERQVAARLEALAGIVAQAEEIAEGADPARSGEMSGLMSEWKKHGHGLGNKGDKVWKRFRAANDRYFEAIGEVRKKRREEFQANIAVREALITRAKALLEGTSPGEAREAVRALMAEWKNSPPVPRRRGDELWEEFRTACDEARDSRRAAAGPADGGAAAGTDDADTAALLARVEETAALPAAERPAAAETIWSEYRRRRRPGQRAQPSPQEAEAEERLTACLREAFETAPESFTGTRFDQEVIAARLTRLRHAAEALSGRGGAGNGSEAGGAESLAEQLQRRLGAGRAADSEASAREAAREAETLRERARAVGFAFAPPARQARARIEKLTAALIAKAPAPPSVGSRRPRRRPPAEAARRL